MVAVALLLMGSSLAAYEVVPEVVDVEAGGGASQVLVRGVGAETISSFEVLADGKRTSYLLARGGGKAAGQMTLVIQAREDAPRKIDYQVTANGTRLPLKIRVVDLGKAKQTGRPPASNQDIREVVREANTSQIVVSADQAPQVLRTFPAPLMVAPDGVAKKVQLQGKHLEAIDDVRVRKADQPPKYRGKQGKLPFTYANGVLEVELMASRRTALGEKYVLDLMVGKFKAQSVGFEIGQPINIPVEKEASSTDGPTVIHLPESASISEDADF